VALVVGPVEVEDRHLVDHPLGDHRLEDHLLGDHRLEDPRLEDHLLGDHRLEDHLRGAMVEGLFLLGSDYLGVVVAVAVAVGAADSRLA